MFVYKKIEEQINSLNIKEIPEARIEILNSLINYIESKDEVRLNFICTHNSRRSHLAQVWAQTLSHFYGIPNVHCFSGGTEETALFPVVVDTLLSHGFLVESDLNDDNPKYSISFSDDFKPIIGFSKKWDNNVNPKSDFAAIMTCSEADEACPFIPGSDIRIPLTYEDPKIFDGTDHQNEKYMERSLQIACELKYVFSTLKAKSSS